MSSSSTSAAVKNATVIGTVLQLAMVLSGHYVEFVRLHVFAVGGMAISLLAGVICARDAGQPRAQSALYGALAGGACALIGIAVSRFLGDVETSILFVGTLGSAVAGAIGGAIAGGRVVPQPA